MSLPLRTLGRNGPPVSPVGLGFGSLGGFYGPPGTRDEKLALLDHAYAVGLRFWDLSDVYGDSEELVGEWLKRSGRREDVFLCTKFSLQRQADGRHTFRSDPQHVKESCDKSLAALGVAAIDLYYCHAVDGVTPIERTIEAMVDLKNQGKIRHVGLSGVSAATLRRAHAVHPVAALQWEYSLFTLDIESPANDILKTCRELGVALVAFSPVGRGVLTGRFRSHRDIPEGDLRRFYPKYAEGNFAEILKLVGGIEDVAKDRGGSTPAQVALAWLLAQGPDIIAIPGTKLASRMDENAGAALLRLGDEEVQRLRDLAERADIKGTRYPAA
ncbi:aldo/keto reductase [Metarhizium acridum CQMa 102]|uniref:Aldo/keto reductase n=1 Tax=Metarhizium acridum (strain CQMa 102) TaxID=655827 RepID=E9DRS6_METAQ|nr:aldo/keto reductase [Metarhizium acridum CQMa 102]EFY93954.1 aldo/keto reductase [Metarhizium acridum CQMa 102]